MGRELMDVLKLRSDGTRTSLSRSGKLISSNYYSYYTETKSSGGLSGGRALVNFRKDDYVTSEILNATVQVRRTELTQDVHRTTPGTYCLLSMCLSNQLHSLKYICHHPGHHDIFPQQVKFEPDDRSYVSSL